MARIGFVGLGNMGGPMLLNLLKAGHQVERFRSRRIGARACEGGRRSDSGVGCEYRERCRVLHQHAAGEPPRRRPVSDAGCRRQNAARSNFEIDHRDRLQHDFAAVGAQSGGGGARARHRDARCTGVGRNGRCRKRHADVHRGGRRDGARTCAADSREDGRQHFSRGCAGCGSGREDLQQHAARDPHDRHGGSARARRCERSRSGGAVGDHEAFVRRQLVAERLQPVSRA